MNLLSAIFTKEFSIYLFYKVGGLLFMVLALYLIFFIEQTNYILVIVLFGASLFFSTSALKMDPKPIQVRCLENKGFMISFFVPTAMTVSLVLILLVLVGGADLGYDRFFVILGSLVILTATLSVYLKEFEKTLKELEQTSDDDKSSG